MKISSLISKEAADKINAVCTLLSSTKIESIKIKTDADAQGALETVVLLKKLRKEIEEKKEIEVEPYKAKHEEIRDSFNHWIEKIKSVCKVFDIAYRNYDDEKKRIAAEKQRLLDQKAADDRRKAEEQAAAAMKKAEELAAAGREDLAAKQDLKAATLQQKAVEIVAPVVSANVVANIRGGFNTRTVWKGRIMNWKEVLKYFYNRGIPPNVLAEIQKYADAQARAAKGVKSTIGGIVFYQE